MMMPKHNSLCLVGASSQTPYRRLCSANQNKARSERVWLFPLVLFDPTRPSCSLSRKECCRQINMLGSDPDFRGYPSMKSLGQDEFQTSYERDPYNLQLKSNHLDQVFGGSLPQRDQAVGAQMGDCPLRQPRSWQRELILPQEPFPNRFKGTTRHRPLYRSPHSAFLQRVETKLSQMKFQKSGRESNILDLLKKHFLQHQLS